MRQGIHFFGRQSARFSQSFWSSLDRFPYRSSKSRLDLQSQKTISLLITITISLSIQIDIFVYRSDLKTTILAFFTIKKFELHDNRFVFTKIVNLNPRETRHFNKNRYYIANKCEKLRAITMCSALTPGCRFDNSTILFLGDAYCPKTRCSG